MAASEWITIDAPEGAIRALAVRPAVAPPWPALIVIHAVMGIDPYFETVVADFAAAGYFAVAPDIYSNDPGYRELRPEHIEIAAHMGADPARQSEALAHYPPSLHAAILKARQWMGNRRGDGFIQPVRAAFDALKERADVRAVGAIGFCMGGRLVGELAASGADLAAGVIYYGGPPKLDLVASIRCPLEGHYASRDTPITSRIPAFAEAMAAAGKDFAYYVYEADHGFSLSPKTRAHDAEATRVATARAKAFLAQHLTPVAAKDISRQDRRIA